MFESFALIYQTPQSKPIDIWVGYIVGQGTSALNSVTVTRNYVQNAQAYFNNNFTNGTVSDVDDFSIVTEYNLSQNYPNPFNPNTKISWQSPVAGHQTLKVFDVLGNEVATLVNEFRNAGSYEIEFNASTLSSGIYFYRLSDGSFIQTKKMILIK